MIRELKARIGNPQKVEKQLEQLGAKFTGEAVHEYTYFKQPPGKVLKLSVEEGKTYKTVIEARGDQFEVVADDVVDNPEGVRAELVKQYGIKRDLTNHRRFFSLGGELVTINHIEGVGDFLIIESEAPSPELLDKLGIDRDAIVTDSFDNLNATDQ